MAEMSRPTLEILRLKQAVGASKTQPMDSDTAEFMRALSAAMDWLGHLEPPPGPQPAIRVSIISDGRRVAGEIGPDVLDLLKPDAWGAVAAARVADMVRELGK